MKTAAKDFICLDGTLDYKSNAINFTRASHAICKNSVNSIKVDYPLMKG